MSFIWDSEAKDWVGDIKNEWGYDSEGDSLFTINYVWSAENIDWQKDKSEFYYYKTLSSVSEEDVFTDLKIYPNPTSGILNISGLTQAVNIGVYSLEGKLLKSESRAEKIDISDLPAGLYFLKLSVMDKTILMKTVLKK